MRIFVTSATGYIGAKIAKLLLAEGHSVGEERTITPFRPHLIELDRSDLVIGPYLRQYPHLSS